MSDKFRNNPELKPLLKKIKNEVVALDGKALPLKFMEVCGTHTVSILKFGFRHFFQGLNKNSSQDRVAQYASLRHRILIR